MVCGLGGSGEAACRLLLSEGYAVTAVDSGGSESLKQSAGELERAGVRVVLGTPVPPDAMYEMCVVSPGIPLDAPLLRNVEQQGWPMISELEFGWSRFKGKTAAVTGSNGKSTAVKWLAESLREAGYRAEPAGNYGVPACQAVLEQPGLDWLVLEVSTFQMETTEHFRADAAILLNIHPNHLDRHGSMDRYRFLKSRLFARSRPEDACITPLMLQKDMQSLSEGLGRWLTFGVESQADFRFENGWVVKGGQHLADLRGTHFDNEVLGLAGAAVVAALEACEIPSSCAAKAAAKFTPLAHRMQPVGEIRGVRFINDSKATNLSAMAAALRMLPKGVRLIAGGLVKEKDFGFVKELLSQKVRGVYLIGKASDEMALAWKDAVPCVPCGILEDAVNRAWADAMPGEIVLLSPACASYDQFRNFEERGDRFIRSVGKLSAENAHKLN
ncbi:MAG: UDP-N-acetylmuramoyl-L-alanine--D-glutamate ligase [Lentisphaerota bacterium]